MKNDKWIELSEDLLPIPVEIIKSIMDANEIPAQISKEGAATAIGVNVPPFGQSMILVPESRLLEAQALLKEYLNK